MKTLRIKLVTLSLFLFGCAGSSLDPNNSYLVKEDTHKCEGSSLQVNEQVKVMREAGRNLGISCIARPLKLPNDEILYRPVCAAAVGEVPLGQSITKDKESCEVALDILKKDPQFGIQRVAQQKMESNLWIVDLQDGSCIPSPYGIEEFTRSLQRETGKICQVKLEEFPMGTLRTINCSDMKTGTAWVATDSEQLCQDFLKALKNHI